MRHTYNEGVSLNKCGDFHHTYYEEYYQVHRERTRTHKGQARNLPLLCCNGPLQLVFVLGKGRALQKHNSSINRLDRRTTRKPQIEMLKSAKYVTDLIGYVEDGKLEEIRSRFTKKRKIVNKLDPEFLKEVNQKAESREQVIINQSP